MKHRKQFNIKFELTIEENEPNACWKVGRGREKIKPSILFLSLQINIWFPVFRLWKDSIFIISFKPFKAKLLFRKSNTKKPSQPFKLVLVVLVFNLAYKFKFVAAIRNF